MEQEKAITAGWKKMGIGICAITALSVKDTVEFRIAIIIGVIAIIGIVTQGILDYRRNLGAKK